MTVYHVFANRSNVGDWLSARGIQSLLAPLALSELLCDDPFVPETMDRFAAACPEDLIVIGGGGLFMDYFEPFWQRFAAIAERTPFCLWGVGCCDMKRVNSLAARSLIGPIAARARLCIVRDELTREFLAGFAESRIVPCPTLNVVEARPLGRGVLHVDAFDNVGEENYERMNQIGVEFAAQTSRPFRAINNLIPAGSERALNGILDQYAAADIILTGRLHGCIIGLAMGRKVLAVSGDRKVESFMTASGLGEYVLGLDELDHLAGRLAEIGGQPAQTAFLDAARRANETVGQSIRRMVR